MDNDGWFFHVGQNALGGSVIKIKTKQVKWINFCMLTLLVKKKQLNSTQWFISDSNKTELN